MPITIIKIIEIRKRKKLDVDRTLMKRVPNNNSPSKARPYFSGNLKLDFPFKRFFLLYSKVKTSPNREEMCPLKKRPSLGRLAKDL